jgi:hypothetical protein
MDVLLIGVSLVSTVVALVMTAVAWRVSRDQRAVSAARVAALSAAASADLGQAGEKPSHATTLDQFEPEPIAVGAARSAPWAASHISSFSATRTSALRAEPHEVTTKPVTIETSSPSQTMSEGFLGGSVSAPSDSGRQRSLAVAAIVLFGVVLVGGYWTVFGDRSSATTLSAANSASPLELVSMRHERRGTRLAVTGLVRNPVAGAPVDRLAAVVFLFDEQGGFITSARANVDFLKLSPGDESPFVIDVEAPSSVARYRVSFRNDAGIVPHIDRRGQQPLAVSTVR